MRFVQYESLPFTDIHVSLCVSLLKRATWFSATMRSMLVKFSPIQVVRTMAARTGQMCRSGRKALASAASRASRMIPMPHNVTMRRVVRP